METYLEAQSDVAMIQSLADGIAAYCQHLIAPDGTEDATEAIDDSEHNTLCFGQISAGLAMLTTIVDRANLTHA